MAGSRGQAYNRGQVVDCRGQATVDREQRVIGRQQGAGRTWRWTDAEVGSESTWQLQGQG